MQHSKTSTFLKARLVATGITIIATIIIIISRLLNLLPFPWGEVANIGYGIALLTAIIYFPVRKVQKEEEKE